MTNQFLTPTEAAARLGIKKRMAQRWCERGKLGQKIGGRYLITEDEIKTFKRPKPGPNPKPR